jgi:hypothetical protein
MHVLSDSCLTFITAALRGEWTQLLAPSQRSITFSQRQWGLMAFFALSRSLQAGCLRSQVYAPWIAILSYSLRSIATDFHYL